ncbi:NAD-dependent epimerase/dehydratase family protein [Arthrobacter sp. JSM 101049]|uniref:NAD-dependent epimerase/dehydratase family protein n=1 Tax=Arthrobacter sp. JSM 101049 TaxID=929097 RepID=UPI0035628646
MAVVIVGCGDVGTEAGLRFAAAGHRVEGWRRSAQVLPAAIKPVVADLAGELPRFPADTEVVVHAPAAGGRSVQAYRRVYLDGLAGVLRALERDRVIPRRIVLVSSTAVYADTEGAWVDETTPADPPTETSIILRDAEELLAARAPQGVVLRLAGIYGPGRMRLVDKARAGAAEPGWDRFTNRIHRDDAAAAIVHLATGVADPAAVYNGVDREPAVLGEVLDFLADRLDVDRPLRDGAGAPSTGKRISGELLRSTGFEFAYPSYREGYAAVLAGEGTRHP